MATSTLLRLSGLRRVLLAAGVAGGLGLATGQAVAGPVDVIGNGSFEQGGFAGWTVVMSSHPRVVKDAAAAFNGSHYARLMTGDGSVGFLVQQEAMVAGDTYDFSFELSHQVAAGRTGLTVSLGDIVLFSDADMSISTYYVPKRASLLWTGSSHASLVFTFTSVGVSAFDKVDAVTLMATAPVSVVGSPGKGQVAVMEPSTVSLLGIALFGLGMVRRRRHG